MQLIGTKEQDAYIDRGREAFGGFDQHTADSSAGKDPW